MKIENWEKLNNIILDINDDIIFELNNAKTVSNDVYLVNAFNDGFKEPMRVKIEKDEIWIRSAESKSDAYNRIILPADMASLKTFLEFLKNCITDYLHILLSEKKKNVFSSFYNENVNSKDTFITPVNSNDLW
jgi:hypothetical protein